MDLAEMRMERRALTAEDAESTEKRNPQINSDDAD